MVYTAEEMKEKVCKHFNMTNGCVGHADCGECWVSRISGCFGSPSERIKRQAILRAILDDKIVWHNGEMCVVVEEDE
jgi:hypothetical protein